MAETRTCRPRWHRREPKVPSVAHPRPHRALSSWTPSTVTTALLVVAVSLQLGCSRKTDLAGDVFVAMQSGDVKRAADTLVMVLPATSQFDQERRALEESFQASVQRHRDSIRA